MNSGSLSIAVAALNGKQAWQAQIKNDGKENVKIAAGMAGKYTLLFPREAD